MAIKNIKTKEDVTDAFDVFIKNVNFEFANDDKLVKVVNEFLEKVKNNLKENDLIASGRLYQSLKPALPFKQRKKSVVVEIIAEDYWKDIEEGTKPKGFSAANFKKLQPQILEWIQNKESLSAIANTEWRKRAFSYLITRSILRKGTIKRFGYKGKKFLTDELPELEKNIIKFYENKWQ